MRVSLKTAVVTGEVTILVACTAVGIHLFMQPHRFAVAPPPLVLPSKHGHAVATPDPGSSQSTDASPAPTPAASASNGLAASLIAQLNHEDRTQVNTEWAILQRLSKTVEWFLEHRVVPAMEGRS